MKKPIIISILAALALYFPALAGPLDFATRISCELQTASGTSLQRMTWQQGTTPLLSVEQFRLGKAIAADTNTDAVVVIGPSATSQYYVAVTNQSTSGNSYLVQMPTIGTNTASGVWWYTVYFERDGRRYWTGNGALTIEATTSTGDGLVWQTITGVSVAALQAALDAEAAARASGDVVAMTNWQSIVYSLTNGAALGETALQPSWAATGTVAHAGDAATATTAENAGAADRAAVADAADYAVEAGFADEALELADWSTDGQALAAVVVHTNDPSAHPDIRAEIDAILLPPEWIGITNLAASVTVTNSYERPVYLYATGTVSVTFSGLRTPMPLYLVMRGPDSLTMPGAYYVGGGTFQTNMSNHYIVWKYGTNLFINLITATED